MESTPSNNSSKPPADDRAQDRKDLHRGVVINTVGNLVKLAHPVLMGVAIWLYGEVTWGIFVTAQAALLPIGRLALLGLDKGLLWWVPRAERGRERETILPVLVVTAGLTTALAFIVSIWLAPWLADWKDLPQAETAIRWMAFGLIPMGVMDVLLSATIGRKEMLPQVVVRDTMWPLTMVGLAVLFHLSGMTETGFALAFLVAGCIGAAGALFFFLRIFRDSRWPGSWTKIPQPLVRYSLPMWGAEVSNSGLQRMDQLVIFALTDAATAGVYGVVMMVGNAIRTIRRAFDPIVTAIFSSADASGDTDRLKDSFSHATALVIGTQAPLFACILLFTPWIIPLIGPAYEAAILPIYWICGFWLINGALGLNGLILGGMGRSDLVLLNVWVLIFVEALLLYTLIPTYGLEGAAIAVGASYSVQNLFQATQARMLTGSWNYRRDTAAAVGISVLAFLAMGGVWGALESGESSLAARTAAFAAFLIAGLPLTWWAWKTGTFSLNSEK